MAQSSDVAARLNALSPAQRALVERLLQQKAQTPPSTQTESLRLQVDLTGEGKQKQEYRQFYDNVSRQLNSSEFGTFSVFLNYGYVANEAPQFSGVALPENYLNRNSVKLVLELVGTCDIGGKDVLDVGCGRGGTLATLNTFFAPRSLTGVDLSAEAVAFDRRTHTERKFAFHEGDAEALPCGDEGFDVVCNVESSHSYPNPDRFYAEVFRVLRTPGLFLYTDLLALDVWASGREALERLGFAIEHDRDITQNVLLSCDQIARARLAAFSGDNDALLMRDFLAAPGSTTYDGMAKGAWQYRILWLRKSGRDR
jgi:SAM-dependent methyltransferase